MPRSIYTVSAPVFYAAFVRTLPNVCCDVLLKTAEKFVKACVRILFFKTSQMS